MRRALLTTALIALPALAFAVGTEEDTPPKTTKTTTECTDGLIYDEKTKECVAPKDSRLDQDQLYRAAREFAHSGQYDAALNVLVAMADPQDDRVLTYKGFATRKKGDLPGGMTFYRQALAQNPGNLLARSYMGQGFVEEGKMTLARAQLTEIRRRGGRGTWAELSLRMAIDSGTGFSY